MSSSSVTRSRIIGRDSETSRMQFLPSRSTLFSVLRYLASAFSLQRCFTSGCCRLLISFMSLTLSRRGLASVLQRLLLLNGGRIRQQAFQRAAGALPFFFRV